MSYGYNSGASSSYGAPSSNNLQFYSSSYSDVAGGVSGHTTPSQNAYSAYGGIGGIGVGGDGTRQLSSGWLAAFGTGGYDDEPPLLEELGINFGHIKMKTLIVLNPLAQVDQHIMDDSDLAGPILFCLAFGTFLLLSGKVHFGYIYGCALLGSISLHIILNLMASPGNSVNYIRSASVLGYCLLPLVFISFVGITVSLNGLLGFFIAAVAISWCTYSSSAMFVAVLRVRDMRLLVAYPLALFYSVFGIMSIFSSKGGGTIPLGSAGLVGKQVGLAGGLQAGGVPGG